MMTSKITIKDIAREAGVSVATVSYVLNQRNDQKISEETRNKVLRYILVTFLTIHLIRQPGH